MRDYPRYLVSDLPLLQYRILSPRFEDGALRSLGFQGCGIQTQRAAPDVPVPGIFERPNHYDVTVEIFLPHVTDSWVSVRGQIVFSAILEDDDVPVGYYYGVEFLEDEVFQLETLVDYLEELSERAMIQVE